ncbi:MAG: CotH kinase family protein [Ruminococcus sp.]|nr:CotH kinase family protein [Ruminococcus sp.]
MKTDTKGMCRKAAALSAALVMTFSMFGTVNASAADINTYESLSVDAEAKKSFEEKIASQTKLPVINVTTNNNSELILSKEIYTECVVDVFNVDEDYELDEVSAGIRVRGNSSAYFGDVEQIKKNPVPYRIKFDSKTNMLGLNDGAQCKSWVLLKSDWDLIRNDIALRMGRTIFGDTAYVSDSQLVHLYVNDQFKGIYVLCEQNQVNKHRVNVTEPEEGYQGTDIGYYLELDNYADREPDNIYFTMDYEGATVTDIRGETRQFVPADYSVKNDVYSQEQVDFINKYLNNSFEILYKAVEKGEYLTFDENFDLIESDYTTAEETITAVMDIESVVDMYLLYEIVHDYDCGEGSFYMCVDFAEGSQTPKLQFTSPWDFNWAYNDSTSRYWAGAFCERWFANQNGDRSNPWFILLAKEDWFMDLCADKWTAETSNVKAAIMEERGILADYPEDLTKTSENAINDANKLLEWIDKRMVWMDKTFTVSEPPVDDNSSKPDDSDPQESSTPESSSSDESNSSDESSSADSSSKAETAKPESSSSANKNTASSENPKTGAAQLSLALCAFACAVAVVNKKKK